MQGKTIYTFNGDIGNDVVNLFPSKEFPIDEQNRLALDRVKSTKVLAGQERVKIACKQGEINQTLFVQTYKFGTVLV